MNEILAAAILQARTDGDTAAAQRLAAMVDQPEQLAALLKQLQTA